MGLIIIVVILAVSIWTLFATFRRLRRNSVSSAWWLAFSFHAIVGLMIGCWLAFRFEYQVSPTMRFASFPIPLCFFHFEDGQWVDFPTPPIVMFPGLFANVVAIIALATLPVLVGSLFIHRLQSKPM